MGRRPSGALPQMRLHGPTNTARIVIGGKVPNWQRQRRPPPGGSR